MLARIWGWYRRKVDLLDGPRLIGIARDLPVRPAHVLRLLLADGITYRRGSTHLTVVVDHNT